MPKKMSPIRWAWINVRDTALHPIHTVKYAWARTVGVALCKRNGHPQDDIEKLLGWCPRCYGNTPTTIWKEIKRMEEAERREERGTDKSNRKPREGTA